MTIGAAAGEEVGGAPGGEFGVACDDPSMLVVGSPLPQATDITASTANAHDGTILISGSIGPARGA